MAVLNAVGIYREMYRNKDTLPSVRDPQPPQSLTDRQDILRYMRSATTVFDVLEDVTDLFRPGNVIPGGSSLISDGRWIWRVDSIHYLADHPLAFPEAFLRHVRSAEYRPPTALPSNDEFDLAVLTYF